MTIALMDNQATLGGAQRYLLDFAQGLISRRRKVIAVLGSSGPLERAFLDLGIPVTVLPPANGPGGWRILPYLVHLFRLHDARMLYANDTPGTGYHRLAMRLAGGRICWRLYRPDDLPAATWQTRWNARLCTKIQVASTPMVEVARARVGQRAQIQVIPPAINLAAYPVHPLPNHKHGERLVIGMLGSWEPRSGHEILIRAVKTLHAGGHSARLRLASIGPSAEENRYRSVIHGAVTASGLADRIVIEGDIRDLPGFIARCDLLVAPWLRESTGRFALEAAAIGRPIIATRVPGLLEIVEDGHTGLLIPPNSEQALSDALALLLASPALCAEMGRQARVRAEEHFSLQAYLDSFDETFPG